MRIECILYNFPSFFYIFYTCSLMQSGFSLQPIPTIFVATHKDKQLFTLSHTRIASRTCLWAVGGSSGTWKEPDSGFGKVIVCLPKTTPWNKLRCSLHATMMETSITSALSQVIFYDCTHLVVLEPFHG